MEKTLQSKGKFNNFPNSRLDSHSNFWVTNVVDNRGITGGLCEYFYVMKKKSQVRHLHTKIQRNCNYPPTFEHCQPGKEEFLVVGIRGKTRHNNFQETIALFWKKLSIPKGKFCKPLIIRDLLFSYHSRVGRTNWRNYQCWMFKENQVWQFIFRNHSFLEEKLSIPNEKFSNNLIFRHKLRTSGIPPFSAISGK